MTKSPIKLFLNTIWVCIFIIAIEHWIGWNVLFEPWHSLTPVSILLAVLILFLSYSVRAVRLYSYMKPEINCTYLTCFKLILQHNFFNNILPMRSGEISFPMLLARYFNVPMAQSVSTLLWFRLLDLHTILGFGMFFIFKIDENPALSLLTLSFWLSFPWLIYHYSKQVRSYLAKNEKTTYSKFLAKILSALPLSSSAFWTSWGWTLINWLIKLMVLTAILRLFVQAPLSATWLGVIAGDLTSILPIHSFAGIGTYEAGIIGAMLPFGINAEEVAQGAINLHFFILTTTFIGYLLAQFIRRNPQKVSESK